ncbi:MAG: hypothetical protein DRN25_00965 [Thermoplasmata archaeon]|nr:MAG: hypothetical protein DRN25_00965 [Thermoplasmata archaeon]
MEDISIKFSKDYKKVYVSGSVGGYSKGEFRINFYSHAESSDEGKTTFFVPITVILTPFAAKDLARWLKEKIEEYEERYGEISEEEVDKVREFERRYREIEDQYDVEEEDI